MRGTTIDLRPATDRIVMCSRTNHRDRRATHTRVVRIERPRSIAFYPECDECARRKPKANEEVRRR